MALNTALTVSILDGLFKEVYADAIADHRPRNLVFQNDIAFIDKEASPGNSYHQPVLLQHEHGFTYSRNNEGAFTLMDPIVGATKDATVIGYQKVLRSRMDYESAARASSGGKRAFAEATQLFVREMASSFRKRTEIDLINGRAGLGTVRSKAAQKIVVDQKYWAPGIWAGSESTLICAFDPVDATAAPGPYPDFIDNGTADTLSVGVAATPEEVAEITGVNMDDLSLTTASSGSGKYDPGGVGATIEDGDHLYMAGLTAANKNGGHRQIDDLPGKWNIPVGIHDILAFQGGPAAGAKNLFGIDTAAYSLWGASTHACETEGELTYADVSQAIVKAVGKGLEDDLVLYCSTRSYAQLIEAQIGVHRWNNNSGPATYDIGSDHIKFYSQNGMITIKSSIYIKQDFAYLIAPELWLRVGATDMTFNLPGRGDEFFRHLENAAGYELRAYDNSAPFTEAPGKGVLIYDCCTRTA